MDFKTLVMTIPGAPAPGHKLKKLKRPGTVQASDTFQDDRAELHGSAMDGAAGGAKLVWQATPEAFSALGGYLRPGKTVSGAANGAAVEIGNANVRFTARVMAMPSAGGTLNFDLRKPRADLGPVYSSCYRLQVSPTGVVRLQRKVDGSSYITVATATAVLLATDVVGVEIYGRQISLIVNGEPDVMWTEENTLLSGRFFEIFVGAQFSLYVDWVKFEALT